MFDSDLTTNHHRRRRVDYPSMIEATCRPASAAVEPVRPGLVFPDYEEPAVGVSPIESTVASTPKRHGRLPVASTMIAVLAAAAVLPLAAGAANILGSLVFALVALCGLLLVVAQMIQQHDDRREHDLAEWRGSPGRTQFSEDTERSGTEWSPGAALDGLVVESHTRLIIGSGSDTCPTHTRRPSIASLATNVGPEIDGDR